MIWPYSRYGFLREFVAVNACLALLKARSLLNEMDGMEPWGGSGAARRLNIMLEADDCEDLLSSSVVSGSSVSR